MTVNVILFRDFETLDIFGPVEILGKMENICIKYYSLTGGIISNGDNVRIETNVIDEIVSTDNDTLFIPGGLGTRSEINNNILIDKIKVLAEKSQYVMTVCTGSALLAKTKLLDGKRATSNKRAFEWVKTSSGNVIWLNKARWVVDDKYYTSSGVSAGIDMALGFISDIKGVEEARRIALSIEYNWQEDKDVDNFCKQ